MTPIATSPAGVQPVRNNQNRLGLVSPAVGRKPPKPKRPWKQAVKQGLSVWMLKFIAKKSPELLVNYVMEKASEMSVGITMSILDKERILHCYKCPQRFSLRKVGVNQYACLNHSQEVKADTA